MFITRPSSSQVFLLSPKMCASHAVCIKPRATFVVCKHYIIEFHFHLQSLQD